MNKPSNQVTNNQLTKKSFYIKGLHCASCVYTTEKALKQIPGVTAATVNLASGKAMVESSKPVDYATIRETIRNSGYEAFYGEEMEHQHSDSKKKELTDLKIKTLAALVVSGLMMFFIKNNIIQLVLATVIQFWAGWTFYKASLPAILKIRANMDTLVAVGTSAAYFYSAAITVAGTAEMAYFETSSTIIGLVLLGRFLEAKAKAGTGDAIKKLIGLQAREATILVNERDSRSRVN